MGDIGSGQMKIRFAGLAVPYIHTKILTQAADNLFAKISKLWRAQNMSFTISTGIRCSRSCLCTPGYRTSGA